MIKKGASAPFLIYIRKMWTNISKYDTIIMLYS